jgi:hypothetical protein
MILNNEAFNNVKIFSSGKHTAKVTAKDKAFDLLKLLNGEIVCSFIGVIKVSAVNENRKNFF